LAERRPPQHTTHARRVRVRQFISRERAAPQRDLPAHRLPARRRDVARQAVGGPMTTFRLATEADDAVIRSLLRKNVMPTWVDLAIEREPSFFAGKDLFGDDWAVIAEEVGDVVGMYAASVMPVHVDGRPERLGSLSGFRVYPRYRHRHPFLPGAGASIPRRAPLTGRPASWVTGLAVGK